MSLGTEKNLSLALALVLPGNIQKIIADARHTVWTVTQKADSKAYFDYPVLAWLRGSSDASVMRSYASRLRVPVTLGGIQYAKEDAFIAFTEKTRDDVAMLQNCIEAKAEANVQYADGPFQAGVGLYFGTVDESIMTKLAVSIRCKTTMLALISFLWSDMPHRGSMWRIDKQLRLCNQT